jgi:hypothetical protein
MGPYSPTSLSARARRRRWNELDMRFPDLARMRVLDLGGDVRHWQLAPTRPGELICLNLYEQESPAWATSLVGDACAPPSALEGERFDLVYSNSVIEHVGGYAKREAFADTVRRYAPHHWVQTPYRYFPIEPHWGAPGLQFLPVAARVHVTLRWPFGYRQADDRKKAEENTLTVELLSRTDMHHHFPSSELWEERLFFMTKSLTAIG